MTDGKVGGHGERNKEGYAVQEWLRMGTGIYSHAEL